MASSADTVLLITHSEDHFTVDRVAEALGRRGTPSYRLDTDTFPASVRLSARLEQNGPVHTIDGDGGSLRADAIRAVWTRKFRPPQLAENLDPQFRQWCIRETQAALKGFLDGLHGVRWVNDLRHAYEAENKLYQLRAASAAGLRIPRTLVTNHSQHARAFHREVGGAMVAKLLTPLSAAMGRAPFAVHTSDVGEDDLADAEQLRHCPMMFQERIPKARELRVAYVTGRTFVGAVDASRSAAGRTDWRRATPEECPWERDELPDDVDRRLVTLMNGLGLAYGAIDVIRTPEGDHVFLEVNPAGEWGMLERDLDPPISDAIAEALLESGGVQP